MARVQRMALADAVAPVTAQQPRISPLLLRQLEQQAATARAMGDQGVSTAPIDSPLQGLARLAQAGLGGFMERQAQDRQLEIEDAQQAAQLSDMQAIAGALEAGSGGLRAILPDIQSPDMRQALAGTLLQQATSGKGARPMVVGAGGALVGPGGEVLHSQPATSKLLSPEEEAQKIRIANATRAPNPIAELSRILAEERIHKSRADRAATEASTLATRQKAGRAEAEADKRTRKAEQVRDEIRDKVDWLIANPDATGAAVGSVDSRFIPTMRDETIKAERWIEAVQNLLTVDNLDLMSGVLSESDVAMLRSISAGGLDFRLGDSDVMEVLKAIRSRIGGKAPNAAPGRFQIERVR